MSKNIIVEKTETKDSDKLILLDNNNVIIKAYKEVKYEKTYLKQRNPKKDKQIKLTQPIKGNPKIGFFKNTIILRYKRYTKFITFIKKFNVYIQQYAKIYEHVYACSISKKSEVIECLVNNMFKPSDQCKLTFYPANRSCIYGNKIKSSNTSYRITVINYDGCTSLILYDLHNNIINIRQLDEKYSPKDLQANMFENKISIIHKDKYIYKITIENEDLETDCGICQENENNIYLIPCGHKMCYSCLVSLIVDDNLECPYCKEVIKDRIPFNENVIKNISDEDYSRLIEAKKAKDIKNAEESRKRYEQQIKNRKAEAEMREALAKKEQKSRELQAALRYGL